MNSPLRLLFGAATFAVLLAGFASCGPTELCNTSNCPTGCCNDDGLCRAGTLPAECGKGGSVCRECTGGSTCTDGVCVSGGGGGGGVPVCSPSCGTCCDSAGKCLDAGEVGNTNCGAGGGFCQACTGSGLCTTAQGKTQCVDTSCGSCLQAGSCVTDGGTTSDNLRCGTGGVACRTCAQGSTCSGGFCVAANCDGKCRDNNGECQNGTTVGACGITGIACVACVGGQTCNNGLCVTPDAGTPGTDAGRDGGIIPGSDAGRDGGLSCGAGLCSNGVSCQPGTSTFACGASGTCQNCNSFGLVCNPASKSCVPASSLDAGSDGGSSGTFTCGATSCSLNNQCCSGTGTPAFCSNGTSNTACGQPGTACDDCVSFGLVCNPSTKSCETPAAVDAGTFECFPGFFCPNDRCCSTSFTGCYAGTENNTCGQPGTFCQSCGTGFACDATSRTCQPTDAGSPPVDAGVCNSTTCSTGCCKNNACITRAPYDLACKSTGPGGTCFDCYNFGGECFNDGGTSEVCSSPFRQGGIACGDVCVDQAYGMSTSLCPDPCIDIVCGSMPSCCTAPDGGPNGWRSGCATLAKNSCFYADSAPRCPAGTTF